MSKSVNVDFVTRQIEVDTDGKEHFISAAMAAKDAEQSMVNAQNAAKEVKEIYNDGNLTPLSDLLGNLGTKLKRWGAIFANKIFASNLPIVYNSVAEMKADTMLWEGMSTKTLGYYTPNDGGGASYLIRSKSDVDVDDGFSIYELKNNLVAELLKGNDTVNVKFFGAVGDGIADDTEAIMRAVATGKNVMLEDGKTYGFSGYGNTFLLNGVRFFSYNGATLKYLSNPNFDGAKGTVFIFRGSKFSVRNLTFDVGGTWVERPNIESGTAWENYLSVRGNILANTRTEECSDFKISNCQFKGGLTSIAISNKSHKGIVENCDASYTIADSYYVDNGSHQIVVRNCVAHHNGDDAFCANVNWGGEEWIPHDVLFENCTGYELHGAVAVSDSGNNITFINCKGITHRNSGLRAEHHLESTYGAGTKNIIFMNCAVSVYEDFMTEGSSLNWSGEYKDYINISYINCLFDYSNAATVNWDNRNNLLLNITGINTLFQNCIFKNIRLAIRDNSIFPQRVNFHKCDFYMIHNVFVGNSASIKDIVFNSCKFTNNGTIEDCYETNGDQKNGYFRCAIDTLNSSLTLINSIYEYKGTDDLPFYALSFDPFSAYASVVTDNDSIKVNNEVDGNKIKYFGGVLLKGRYNPYSTLGASYNMANGTLYFDGTQLIVKDNDGVKQKFTPVS